MALRFLLGTHVINLHLQHLALALLESDLLEAWETGWIDLQSDAAAGSARSWVRSRLPRLHRKLARRGILPALEPFVRRHSGWELMRTASSRVGAFPLLTDWLHDRAIFSLERHCASEMEQARYAGFVGVEYGALAALRAAREQGKVGMLAFLSPHHAFRSRWVDREYDRFPELMAPQTRRLLELGRERDQRRDAETQVSDVIHAASQVTADSLAAAGVSRDRILVAPLGAPTPLAPDQLPREPGVPVRILYAGAVAVHKGVHYLLEAWKALAPGRHAELHLCGTNSLPTAILADLPANVFVHGQVSRDEVFRRYRESALLAFPSLCDGFGLVVPEALSQGLPVVTTVNAGAAMMIEEGRNGFVIPAADAQALASRLEWCLAKPAALHAMRPAALEAAAAYSWDRYRATLRAQLGAWLARHRAP